MELAAASQTQQFQVQPGQVNPYAQPQAPAQTYPQQGQVNPYAQPQAPAQTYPQQGQVNPYVQPQAPVQAYPQQGGQQSNVYSPQAYVQVAKRRPAWFWPVVIGAPIAGILLLVLILWACGVFGGSAGPSGNPKQLVETAANSVMKGELGKLIDVVDPVELKKEKDSLKDLRQQLASAEKFLKPLLGTFLREAKVQIKDFRPSDKEALRRPENGEEYDFNGVIQFRNFKNPLTGESMDQEVNFNVELVYRNGLWYFSTDGFQNFMSKAFSPIN